MVSSAQRWRIFTATCVVVAVCLCGCGQSAENAREVVKFRADLKAISVSLRPASGGDVGMLAELLDCQPQTGMYVERVSAERLDKLKQELGQALISKVFQEKVRLDDPEAVGSSYQTWCMPAEKWRLAADFYLSGTNFGYCFPILWTKKPELFGDTVSFLDLGGATYSVSTLRFDFLLKEASLWVDPSRQNVDELLRAVNTGSNQERIYALRLLGARRDAAHIGAITNQLNHGDVLVRKEAVWALGWIGSPDTVPVLADLLRDEEAVRVELATALGRIGTEAVVPVISRLLMDESEWVRRTAVRALPGIKSGGVRGLLIQALQDRDKSTQQEARRSLERLERTPR